MLNVTIESKPSGKVRVEVYCPDTNPVQSEHLMNRCREMHAEVVADVARAWGIRYEPDAEVTEAGD